MVQQTRESRHILVNGISSSVPDDRINTFFSAFGRLEKISRNSDGILVSFMDVRAAQKAYSTENRLDGVHLKVAFQELATSAKNGLPSTSLNLTSPKTNSESSKRQSLSPGSAKESQRSSLSAAKRPLREHRRDGRSPEAASAASSSPCTSGLQGFSVEGLPQSRDQVLEDNIKQELRHYGKPAYIVIEKNGLSNKATVVFNSVSDLEKLLGEKYLVILGSQCRLRHMDPIELQVYHSNQLAITSAVASAVRDNEIPARYGLRDGMVDVYSTKASRTLYVGNLKHRQNHDHLKAQYEHYGHILDVDVKNFDSPSPYAFIQFTDIDSVVKAINIAAQDPATTAVQRKGKPNFGRSMATNKLWVGAIPAAATENYVQNKLRTLLDGAEQVHYDSVEKQAIVMFSNLEKAQHGYSKIRNGICHLKCDGQESRLSVDFCSDSLANFFIDRIHNRNTVSQNINTVLQPPPDPPSDMPAYNHRYEHHRREARRSPSSSSRRRERSRTRSRERNRSKDRKRHRRTTRYTDYERGSSRRRERKDRSASAESSSSSGTSSTNSSRNSSAQSYKKSEKERRREERKDRERDRRNRSPRTKSPLSSNKWRDRHEDRIPPMLTSLERIDVITQERAQSGDSGFSEEPRPPLDPPPAPPLMDLGQSVQTVPPVKEPVPENSPPPNDPPMGPQRLPPQLMSPPATQRHSLQHQVSSHGEYSTTPKSIHSSGCNNVPGMGHRPAEPVKRASLDGTGHSQKYPMPPHGQAGPPKPVTVPCKYPWQMSKNKPIMIANEVIGEGLVDPRLSKPYGISRMLPKSLPHPTCYHEFMTALKDHPELRKRSSGSTASGDANRRHSSSSSRMQSFDDPTTPKQLHSQHGGCHSAVSRTSSLADNEMELAEAELQYSPPSQNQENRPSPLDFFSDPQGLRLPSVPINNMRTRIDSIGSRVQAVSTNLEHHSMEVNKSSAVPAASPKTPQSFAERLKQMRERGKKRELSLKLSDRSNPCSEPSTATPTGGADVNFAKALAQSVSRTSLPTPLHINTSPAEPSPEVPGSTNGATRNDISPVSRKMGISSASHLSKAAPSTPTPTAPHTAGPILTSPPASFTKTEQSPVVLQTNQATPSQQPSPLLSAPPPPPQLHTAPRSDHLRSPPTAPVGLPLRSPLASPTSVASGRHFSTSTVPLPIVNTAAVSPNAPLRSMSMSSVPRPAPSKPTATASRHDSLSTIKAASFETPLKNPTTVAHGTPDNRKTPSNTPKDTSKEFLDSLFNSTPSTSTIRRLPKIEKKVTIGPPGSGERSAEKEKHRKEHKEQKYKRKEDGTLETKEERAKRREAEKAKKRDREDRKEKKKEKKSKEERKRPKDDDKERKSSKSKKEDRDPKERKKKKKEKEKDRKRKYESSGESEETENDDSLAGVSDDETRALIKKLMKEDRNMYDRVKRRSSAANKDDAKQSALDKLKGQKKKKRILLSSSDEEDDGEEQHDSDEGSEQSEQTSRKNLQEEIKKIPKKKAKHSYTSSESDDESESESPKNKPPVPNMEDVFGANSSGSEAEGHTVKEKKEKKKDKHHNADDSDAHSKHSTKSKKKRKLTDSVDMEAIFGSDHNDEKQQKKEKKIGRPRKRANEDHSDDGAAKRSKRSSVGSEASVDTASVARKARLLSKDSTDTEEHRSERASSITEFNKPHPSESHEASESRPRIMSKGAMKAFESGPSTSLQLTSDESDLEEVSMDDKGSKDSSSSSSSSEESDNESQTKTAPATEPQVPPPVPEETVAMEVEATRTPSPVPAPIHEEMVQTAPEAPDAPEAQEAQEAQEVTVEAVQEHQATEKETEPIEASVVDESAVIQQEQVVEEITVTCEPEHPPVATVIMDEEAEKAVQHLPTDDHFFDEDAENAVAGLITEEEAEGNNHIFDDYDEEQDQLYPSHSFMPELKEPGPGDVIEELAQDISEAQILAESVIEEPILEEADVLNAVQDFVDGDVASMNEPEDSRDQFSSTEPQDVEEVIEEKMEVPEQIKEETPERTVTPASEPPLDHPVKESSPETEPESIKEEPESERLSPVVETTIETTTEPVPEEPRAPSPAKSEISVQTAKECTPEPVVKSPRVASPLYVEPPAASPARSELISPKIKAEPPKAPSPILSESGRLIQSMPTFEELSETPTEEPVSQPEPVPEEAEPEPARIQTPEAPKMTEPIREPVVPEPTSAITAAQLMTVPTTSCTLPTIAATSLPEPTVTRTTVEIPATTVIQGPAPPVVSTPVQAPVTPVASIVPQQVFQYPQMSSPAASAAQQLQKMMQMTSQQAQVFQYPNAAEVQQLKAQQQALQAQQEQAVRAQAQAQAEALAKAQAAQVAQAAAHAQAQAAAQAAQAQAAQLKAQQAQAALQAQQQSQNQAQQAQQAQAQAAQAAQLQQIQLIKLMQENPQLQQQYYQMLQNPNWYQQILAASSQAQQQQQQQVLLELAQNPQYLQHFQRQAQLQQQQQQIQQLMRRNAVQQSQASPAMSYTSSTSSVNNLGERQAAAPVIPATIPLQATVPAHIQLQQAQAAQACGSPLLAPVRNGTPSAPSTPAVSSDEKVPMVWRGMLQVKHSTVNVQLFKIFGSNEFTELCLKGAVHAMTPQDQLPNLKINQRMRIEGNRLRDVFSKLPTGAACICLASGTSREDTSRNNTNLNQEFVEYLNQKCSAGISVFPDNRLSYILPPNEYTDQFLSTYSPVLFQKLKSNPSLAYLFIALIPSDVVATNGSTENTVPTA